MLEVSKPVTVSFRCTESQISALNDLRSKNVLSALFRAMLDASLGNQQELFLSLLGISNNSALKLKEQYLKAQLYKQYVEVQFNGSFQEYLNTLDTSYIDLDLGTGLTQTEVKEILQGYEIEQTESVTPNANLGDLETALTNLLSSKGISLEALASLGSHSVKSSNESEIEVEQTVNSVETGEETSNGVSEPSIGGFNPVETVEDVSEEVDSASGVEAEEEVEVTKPLENTGSLMEDTDTGNLETEVTVSEEVKEPEPDDLDVTNLAMDILGGIGV